MMIDLHCHILPGVDDGPDSWKTSAEMCRIAAKDGIRHIVATPHANDRYGYDRSRYERLLSKLGEIHGGLEFSLGCDFHFSFDNIEDAVLHPRRYTIADSNYLLIEFSNFSSMTPILQGVFRLVSRGMIPIVTHPERNAVLLHAPESVLELVRNGCLVQVTADSFTGHWGERSQAMAEWLLKHDAIHFIASDAHDPVRRPPILSKAFDRVCQLAGHDVAHALLVENPSGIVALGSEAPSATSRQD